MKELFQKLTEQLEQSQNVVIISHNRPDGDTTGANLALRLHLETLGKQVTSACADPLANNLKFLPKADQFVQEFLLEDFDTVIIVDAGAKHLVRFFDTYPEINRTKKPIICIDHHYSNDSFGTLNLIDPEETSTTSLLFRYFQDQNIEITPEIATCLLNGIYTDTGSFMHANTRVSTIKMAAELTRLGADREAISKQNFQTTSVRKLKLMGEVLANIESDENGKTVAGVSNALLQKYNATSDDLGGVVDFINSIPNTEYTVLYTEDDKGNVKASLRTQTEEVNVAEIASQYGGGGHPKAAGFRVPGRLKKEVKWTIEKPVNISN